MLSTALLLAASIVVGQAEKEQIPKETIAELGRLVGTWKMVGEEGKDSYTAIYKNEWASGRFALQMRCDWSGTWVGNGIGFLAWDGVKKEFFGPEAYDDGTVCRLQYSIKSPGVWVGETQNSLAGKGAYRANIRLEFTDADHYTWTATHATLNGQAYPDMKLTFARKVTYPD